MPITALNGVTPLEFCEIVYSPNMASNRKFDGLTQRIAEIEKAVEQINLLRKSPDAISPIKSESWPKRHPYWVACLSLLLGSGLFWKVLMPALDAEIDSRTEKPNAVRDGKISRIEDRLQEVAVEVSKISGKLDVLADLEKERLKKLSDLKPRDLKGRLPEVAEALSAATVLGASVPTAVGSALQRNLSSIDERGSNFWSAAVAMVNYRSAGNVAERLPPCDLKDQAPAQLAESVIPGQKQIKIALIPFENCEVVLDAPEAQARYLEVLGLFDIKFQHCRVIYRGGTLMFPARAAPGRTKLSLIFEDCTFEISAPGIPPKDGRQMIATLLGAKDNEPIQLTISAV